jgi:SAM-dependent methyltransferase
MNCDEEQIIEYYKVQGITEIINAAERVGWVDEQSQYLRFDVFYNLGITSCSTILDYGCGLGHMIDYLKGKGHNTEKDYLGLDILENFILAAKKIYPEHKFIAGDIYDIEQCYDYVLASGTFTIGTTEEQMLKAIKKAYTLANKGIAFNLMHNEHPLSVEKHLHTYNPTVLIETLKKEYKNVTLIDDYLPKKDFTIYINK